MLFSWFKRRRRTALLRQPFPDAWLEVLRTNVAHYATLDAGEQSALRDLLRVFVAEKNWEGCGGLTITDEIKVTIAAEACLLLLGLEHDYFNRALSILVYPTQYAVPVRQQHGGIEWAGESQRLGEAWYRGPVVLSWEDVLYDCQNPGEGQNLVLHEFAHQLDFLDRESDGTPPLSNRSQYRKWQMVMTAEFERLIAESEAGQETLLDPYGATNEAEFFAVATECFFDQPIELRDEHGELYDLLREYFGQDPASRHERAK